MPQAIATMPGTLRVLRTIHGALMVAICLYVYTAEIVLRPAARPIDAQFYDGMAIVAFVGVVIAFVMRGRLVRPAFAVLRANPDDAGGHSRWRTGVIISDALAMSVVLYGFVLRFMGATSAQAAPFYIGGFALMILWWPRRP